MRNDERRLVARPQLLVEVLRGNDVADDAAGLQRSPTDAAGAAPQTQHRQVYARVRYQLNINTRQYLV